MAFEVKSEREVTQAEAKRILEKKKNLDELQRRTLDYASKFSRLDAETTEKLVDEISRKFDLERGVVVQIVNCMPTSQEEIRIFLGRERILPSSTLEGIKQLLDRYRKAGK
ncbi:MAG: hypothetical protein ACE5OY_05720 [Candidatus Bathyarchaeia archaeon]